MTTVWLVTYGSYDDYRVVGAYSTEGKARFAAGVLNARRARHNDEDARVEEYKIDAVNGATEPVPYWW